MSFIAPGHDIIKLTLSDPRTCRPGDYTSVREHNGEKEDFAGSGSACVDTPGPPFGRDAQPQQRLWMLKRDAFQDLSL